MEGWIEGIRRNIYMGEMESHSVFRRWGGDGGGGRANLSGSRSPPEETTGGRAFGLKMVGRCSVYVSQRTGTE